MGVEPVCDTRQVVNDLDLVPRDALKCTDSAQGGWSGQFGLRPEQDMSEVL